MIIREVPADQRRAARDQIESWGYPRALTLSEELYGYWVRSELGFLWFVEGPRERREWMVHCCLDPQHRGGPGADPESFAVIRVIAGLLGAVRVYAPLGAEYPGWARHLAKMGFDQRNELGPYFDLEAEPWV